MLAEASPPPQAQVQFTAEVEVHGDLVRLADLADLSVLPPELRRDAAKLAVLRIPGDRDVVVVGASPLRARVAALAPELKPWLGAPQDGAVRIHYDRPAPSASNVVACLKVVGPTAADTVISYRDVVAAPCAEPVVDGLWLDQASGVMRARHALEPGEVLRAPPASALAAVAPGDLMVLEATVGPVRVQRRVQALQAARPGEGLFAKTADGVVISIPSPTAAP